MFFSCFFLYFAHAFPFMLFDYFYIAHNVQKTWQWDQTHTYRDLHIPLGLFIPVFVIRIEKLYTIDYKRIAIMEKESHLSKKKIIKLDEQSIQREKTRD